MGATEEQMQLLADAEISHVAYILVLYSMACLLFLCKFLHMSIPDFILHLTSDLPLVVNVLIHIYGVYAWPETATYKAVIRPKETNSEGQFHDSPLPDADQTDPEMNGHTRTLAQARHIRDAQEFELEGLMGAADRGREEEDDDSPIDNNTTNNKS